jgi:chromosome segregation ATPase
MQQEKIEKYIKRVDALESSLQRDMERVSKRASELRNEKTNIDKMVSDTRKELEKYNKMKEKYAKETVDQSRRIDMLSSQISILEEGKMLETQEKVMELAIKMGEVKTDTAYIKNASELLKTFKNSIRNIPIADDFNF